MPNINFHKNQNPTNSSARAQESQVHLRKPKNTNLVLKGLLCLLKGASFLSSHREIKKNLTLSLHAEKCDLRWVG